MLEYIDFHIEISSLLHFVNEQIESNTPIPINMEETFDCLKGAIISSETKPFLLAKVANEDSPYYQKYVRLENEFQEKFIPDFFNYKGDFYDLDANLNIAKRNTNDKVFKHLFLLKLLEVKSARLSLNGFLNFQLYDNFYGDKEGLACFLVLLTGKDINPYLLALIKEDIYKWIKDNGQTAVLSLMENEENNIIAEGNDQITNLESIQVVINENDFFAKKQNLKLRGHFTDDEIRHYFSFLYLEKGADKESFLSEEAVKQIFSNGLLIPQEPLVEKFELHRDPRFPKKIIDFAIHKLIGKHSYTLRDKNDYLIFMGSYIKDYEGALLSFKKLVDIGKNLSGEKPSRSNINWNNYLPERFQDK